MKKIEDRRLEEKFQFFLDKLLDLMQHHKSRYVLLREKKVIGIYDNIRYSKLMGDRFLRMAIMQSSNSLKHQLI